MRPAFAAFVCALLAGCGSPEPAPQPSPTVTPDKPKSLVPADLAQLALGARIEGPQGTEVTSAFAADGETLAEVVSYVACPEGIDPCDPAELPADTVFTYVHRVTPADGIEGATLFRTSRAATGFANVVGFDKAEAAEVLGKDGKVDVSADNGALVWRVIGGDGWQAGEPMTFFWQGTVPPEGPQESFRFEADGISAAGTGPFPPREVPVDEPTTR